MCLNVPDIDTFFNSWGLVQVTYVVGDCRVLSEELFVSFEVHDVYGVEPDEGHKEADISFSQDVPTDVALLGKDGLNSVQRIKQVPGQNR